MTTDEARKEWVADMDEVLNLSPWVLPARKRDFAVAARAYWQTASTEELMRFISLIPPE